MKTKKKIEFLADPTLQNNGRVTVDDGIANLPAPSVQELTQARNVQFRIAGDSAELRRAVELDIGRLQTEYPNWRFSARFGVSAPDAAHQ